MFWGVINWYGQEPFVLVEDTLDNKDYADLLLDTIPETLEDLNLIHPYILDDNATAHTTSHVKKTKCQLGLKRFESYPPNSPDLNPLENVWSFWKDKIKAKNPESLEQLEEYAYEEWDNIPLEFLRKCIGSMRDRLQEVIKNQGRHTSY